MALELEAGDIVASEGTKFTSRVIQFMTRSCWSHVGIVTPNGDILEATKVDKKDFEDKPVRPVKHQKFTENTASIIVFRRKAPMTDDQRDKFETASAESILRIYAEEQAAFSNALPTIKLLLAVYFGVPCAITIWYIMMNNSPLTDLIVGLKLLGILMVFWGSLNLLLNWSFRCQWGKQTVQDFYKKRKVGRWLVDRENNDMFCSKLVARFDDLSGGLLNLELNSLNDPRPIEVVKAARKHYDQIYQVEGPVKSKKWWSYVFFWLRR
jgi:hypothetical protein